MLSIWGLAMWLINWSQKFGQSYDWCTTAIAQQWFILLYICLEYSELSWDENYFPLHLWTLSMSVPVFPKFISQNGMKYLANDSMLQNYLSGRWCMFYESTSASPFTGPPCSPCWCSHHKDVCFGVHSVDDEWPDFRGTVLPWLPVVISAAHVTCARTLKENRKVKRTCHDFGVTKTDLNVSEECQFFETAEHEKFFLFVTKMVWVF